MLLLPAVSDVCCVDCYICCVLLLPVPHRWFTRHADAGAAPDAQEEQVSGVLNSCELGASNAVYLLFVAYATDTVCLCLCCIDIFNPSCLPSCLPSCPQSHTHTHTLPIPTRYPHTNTHTHRQQRPWPSCYTYGSPPVLAHERGGGGPPVLQALGGLPPDALNSFVLEMDPVPRALLSVDPTFQLFTVSLMVV